MRRSDKYLEKEGEGGGRGEGEREREIETNNRAIDIKRNKHHKALIVCRSKTQSFVLFSLFSFVRIYNNGNYVEMTDKIRTM